jgi:hypothetical protein
MSTQQAMCIYCHASFNTNITCQELYNEIAYYTLSLQDNYFIHQLLVDTFASQHSNIYTKPIKITFALIGLYLVNERNYTGKQVQQAHIDLANKNKSWPHFQTSSEQNWITIQDVIKVPDNQKQEMIKKWCKSAWEVWKPEESRLAEIASKYLD